MNIQIPRIKTYFAQLDRKEIAASVVIGFLLLGIIIALYSLKQTQYLTPRAESEGIGINFNNIVPGTGDISPNQTWKWDAVVICSSQQSRTRQNANFEVFARIPSEPISPTLTLNPSNTSPTNTPTPSPAQTYSCADVSGTCMADITCGGTVDYNATGCTQGEACCTSSAPTNTPTPSPAQTYSCADVSGTCMADITCGGTVDYNATGCTQGEACCTSSAPTNTPTPNQQQPSGSQCKVDTITAKYTVFWCGQTSNTKGEGEGGACDNNSADFKQTLISENMTLSISPGKTFKLEHPGVTCGRVQIDLGNLKAGSGVYGGDTYDTGIPCQEQTPNPSNTQPPVGGGGGAPPTETPTEAPPPEQPTNTPTEAPIPTDTPTDVPPTETPTEAPTSTPTNIPPTNTPTVVQPTATIVVQQPTATPYIPRTGTVPQWAAIAGTTLVIAGALLFIAL